MKALRSLLVIVMVLALAGPSGLMGGSPAHAEPAAAAAPAEGLNWGYKDSWRSYIGAKGIRVLDGASINPDGTFHFPVVKADYDPATRTTTVEFGGTVDFRGYCSVDHETPSSCLLWSILSRPRVVISESQQAMSVELKSAPRDNPGAVKDYGRIPFARLGIGNATVDTAHGRTSWTGVRTALSSEAGGDPTSYPAGSALDDLNFTYRGEGGKPDLGERFSRPGEPVFAEGFRLPVATENPMVRPEVFASPTDPVTFTVTSEFIVGRPQVAFVALDENTKKEIATLHVPYPTTAAVHYIGRLNSFFTLRTSGDLTEFIRLRWTGADFETEVLETVSGSEPQNYQLTGTEQSAFLVVVPRTQQARVVEWREGAPVHTHPLPFVDQVPGLDKVERRRTRHLYDASLPVASDGRLIFLPSQSDIVTPSTGGGVMTVIALGGDAPAVTRHHRFGAVVPIAAGNGQVVLHGVGDDSSIHTTRWDTSGNVVGDPVTVPAAAPGAGPVALAYGGGVSDGAGMVFLPTRDTNHILVVQGGTVVSAMEAKGTQLSIVTFSIPTAYARGGVYALARRGNDHEIVRVDKLGTTARFTTQPKSSEVTLVDGARSKDVTWTAAAEAEPQPSLQWQQKLAGESTFTDLPGATRAELTVKASVNGDGAQYRVVAKNRAGAVASDTIDLTVRSSPIVESHPVKAATYEHQEASFSVLAIGTGALRTGWEFKPKGKSIWTPLAADENFVADGSTLRIVRPGLDLDGFEFRAVVGNDYGVTRSQAAPLTVQPRPNGGSIKTFTGVTFDWAGSLEWQRRPPNGSAAHYLSAGVSDGTRATYRPTDGGTTILQRTAAGQDHPADWDSRGAHVTTGGNQVVRLTNGTAVIEPSGAAKITWPATFSINFYDGLVPATMSDLVLTVTPEGRGELRADLAGYAGDMSNPDKPKEAVSPRRHQVVATFRNVVVDPERGFVVTPDYAGVRLNTPPGETAQKREGDGWGSWPQEFVDFHFTTHLAAYFYSTGGSFDPHKAPLGIGIGFAGATPVAPVPEPTPTPPPGGGTPDINPVPPVVGLPGGGPGSHPMPGGPAAPPSRTGVEGTLLWGVKASFRSYISGPVAKGRITLDGVGDDGGSYRFGQSRTTWDARAQTGSTHYRGGVKFWGHGGVLDITMSDPAIRIDPGGRGSLIMKVSGPGLSGQPVELGHLDLGAAAKQTSADGVAYNNVPVTLTGAGSKVFSYGSSVFYQPGTPMDPLSFVVGANAGPGSVGGGLPPRSGAATSPKAGGLLPTNGALPGAGAPRAGGAGAPQGLPPVAEVGCTIEKANLSWGFKESFRAYISGSIAHGSWTPIEGAGYRTPRFEWPQGTGRHDGRTHQGQVDFAGGVRFSGHDGLLDTTISAPRIRFIDERSAVLLLDVAGVTMESALAGKKEPVVIRDAPFATLDLTKGTVSVSPDGKTITAENVPTALTEQGFVAFPNYPVGTAFDPVSFSITTGSDCLAPPGAMAAPAALQGGAPVAGPAVTDGSPGGIGWPWLAGIGGGIALLAAGVSTIAAVLVHRSTMNRFIAALNGGGQEPPDGGPVPEVAAQPERAYAGSGEGR